MCRGKVSRIKLRMKKLRALFLFVISAVVGISGVLLPKAVNTLPLIELATFGDWSVFSTSTSSNEKMCYALSTPYKTRALSILRNLPFVVFKHAGGEDFTISATSGFDLSDQYGLVFEINNRNHRLTEGSNSFTWTSSYIQDRAIIEDLLHTIESGTEYFQIRSYAEVGDSALDYYSILGLPESMRYIVRNCK